MPYEPHEPHKPNGPHESYEPYETNRAHETNKPHEPHSMLYRLAYASMFAKVAFFSMNSLRGPTSSPISMEKT